MSDADTPTTAVERALVSDRLDRLLESICDLKGLARASDTRLGRLVELAESRERREEEEARWRRQQEAARTTWLRSVVSREVLVPLVTALAGLAAGAVGVRSAAGAPTETPPAVTAPGPSGPSGPQEKNR